MKLGVPLVLALLIPTAAFGQGFVLSSQSLGQLRGSNRSTLKVSDDLRHVAYIADVQGGQAIVLDGVAGPVFDRIDWPFFFDSNGTLLIYTATRAAGRFVVRNGEVAGPFVSLTRTSSEAGLLLMTAKRADSSVPIVMGVVGRQCDDGSAETLTFSPNGQRWAYTVRRKGKTIVVSGDSEFGPFDGVIDLAFTPDSEYLAFNAKEGSDWRAVLDGTLGRKFVAIRSRIISDDSRHVAYIAMKRLSFATVEYVVVDDRVVFETDRTFAALALSADGARVAATAQNDNGWTLFVSGADSVSYAEIQELTFCPDGRLAYVATQNGKAVVSIGQSIQRFDRAFGLTCLAKPARIAFQANQDGKDRYVIAGVAGPQFARISNATTSDDRTHVWYEASDDLDHSRIVIDNRPDDTAYEGSVVAPADSMMLSANGQRYAYLGFRDDKYFIVVDGHEVTSGDLPAPLPFVRSGSAMFSPDSAHVAVAVVRGTDVVSVVDGVESVGWVPVVYGPDGAWLVSWGGMGTAARRLGVNGVEVARIDDAQGELGRAGVFGTVYFEAARRFCFLTIAGDELRRACIAADAPR